MNMMFNSNMYICISAALTQYQACPDSFQTCFPAIHLIATTLSLLVKQYMRRWRWKGLYLVSPQPYNCLLHFSPAGSGQLRQSLLLEVQSNSSPVESLNPHQKKPKFLNTYGPVGLAEHFIFSYILHID